MKNKNFLLHGATNCNSSNYGDYIYGDMIYSYLKQFDYNVQFYQPSDFFKNYLKKYNKNSKIDKKCADYIVYIPGGYFGEGPNARLRDNIIQFIRFMPLGIWAAKHNKRIIVLGVGAGPLNSHIMKYGVKKICNKSQLITVRDHNSFMCLKNISQNDNIIEAGDLILTYKVKFENELSKQNKEILEKAKGKKIFIIHFNHDKTALEKFAKAINEFSRENKDYYYVVTSDSILNNEEENISTFSSIANFDFYHFCYNNPYELSSLLNLSNIVLTCKLHVGVVSSLLNKSVIVAACHYEKTRRFYEQINNSDRCLDLNEASFLDIYNLINKKKNTKVIIPKKEIEKAKITWDLFAKSIGEK